MQQPLEDNPTSWIEEIDPEPPRPQEPGEWRELAVGLIVLLAALGWAGWLLLSQMRNESEYRLGEQAFAAHRLDEARAHFGAITDYKDAGVRAREIAQKLAERDAQYKLATESSAAKDWLPAYSASRRVGDIQPGYRDSATLFGQAREHIYTGALSGTLFLRLDATPPGLYYRAGDRWTWLEGSDAWSEVGGIGPPGHVVYDVPDTNNVRASSISPSSGAGNSKLMLATWEGGATFEPLNLDPAAFDFYIWGERGVWGLNTWTIDRARLQYGVKTSFSGYDITYEAYGSGVTSDVKLGGGGWAVMDFAPDGRHLLLADVSDYSISHPLTRLYLSDGDGTNLRLLYTYDGGLYRAIFSPDSRHVLITTYSSLRIGSQAETQKVVLLDVSGKAQPQTLAGKIKLIDGESKRFRDLALGSSFVQSGSLAGDVLLVDWEATDTGISVINPDKSDSTILKGSVPEDLRQTDYTWSGEVENDGGLLLVFQGTPENGKPFIIIVDTQRSARHPIEVKIELQQDERLQRAWLRYGELVYAVAKQPPLTSITRHRGDSDDLSAVTLFSYPLGPVTGRSPQKLQEVRDTGLDYHTISKYPYPLTWSRSIVIGEEFLAFGDAGGGESGRIGVESYDGSTKVAMPDKGYKLYDKSQYEVFRGLR